MARLSLRPWRVRALSTLGLLSVVSLCAPEAWAQDAPVHTTSTGQHFSLDPSLRAVAVPPGSQAELAFSDGTPEPLWLFVTTRKGAFAIEDAAARQKLIEGVTSGARAVLADFTISEAKLGQVDPTERSFTFGLSGAGASLASRMLAAPEQGPTWQAVRSAGQDDKLLRCLLAELLNGASAVDAHTLDQKAIPAAISCRASWDRVQRFIQYVDKRAFAPSRWQLMASVSVDMSDLLVFWVVTPEARAAEGKKLVDALASELAGSQHRAWLGAARNVGVALGALLAILTFGGGIAWLAVRFTGASPTLSVAAPLAVLHASALLGLSLGPADLTAALVQLAVYVVASACLFRPLQRWVVKHASHALVHEQEGLSTLEYAILFIVVLIAAIGSWHKLGDPLYATGLSSGLLQGYTPGGFIAQTPDTSANPFELGRELGQLGANLFGAGKGVGAVLGGYGTFINAISMSDTPAP